MKLRDLLKITGKGQIVIVRLMYPTGNEKFGYDMEFNFIHHRNDAKLDPIYIRENSNAIVSESERKELTDVLNILLKMNVK